jgi:regulator of protease activity HflC (stomatin/prohibitin superfamily)
LAEWPERRKKMFKTEEGLKAGKVIFNVTSVWILGIICVVVIVGGALIDWVGFGYLGLAAIIAVLVLNSIVIVPTVYFGIVTRFKQRMKREDKVILLEEGINFVFPLVDDLLPDNTKSRKLTTEEVKATALSKDKLEINLKGSVQYRPEDLNTYIEMTPKTIKEGMIDAIESELGKICGTKNADIFVEYRSEVELLIQCVLQLERPPHHYINKEKQKDGTTKNIMGVINAPEDVKKELGDEKIEKLTEKLLPEKWELKEEEEEVIDESDEKKLVSTGEIDVIGFYKDNVSRISLLFDIPFGKESKVGMLYGIKVATFRLARLSFSKEAQEAFEKMRAARAEMAAAEKRFETKVGLLRKYIAAGLSPREAVNLVETTSDVKGVTRQIVSVEGSQSADLLAFAKLLAGTKGGEK